VNNLALALQTSAWFFFFDGSSTKISQAHGDSDPTFTANDLYKPLRKLHSSPANGFKGKHFRPWLLLVLLREVCSLLRMR